PREALDGWLAHRTPPQALAPTPMAASVPDAAPEPASPSPSAPASASASVSSSAPASEPAPETAPVSESETTSATVPMPASAPPAASAAKPILVLLATSGGAYRAGFWTSLLMDRLIAESGSSGRWPGLAGDIRLITGASGGMVAGAYFVAMAAEGRLVVGITNRISQDPWDRLDAPDGDDRRHPNARDSLSPEVLRPRTRDLGHLTA